MDLFADDDGGNLQVGSPSHQSPSDFQINKSYANRFEHNKQRAELHRLEEKYGKAAADILSGQRNRPTSSASSSASSSSDDETEDEEGEQVTAEVDAAILRTLAKIRSGDASIYDSSKKVFDEEKALAATSASLPRLSRDKTLGKGKKKMTLADYQRERLRDWMDTEEDPAKALAEATTSTTRREEEERQRRQEEEEYRNRNRPEPLSHVQEQELLKRQVTQAFHQMDPEEGEEGEGFFTKRRAGGEDDGTQDDDDPQAYRKYLLANLGQDGAEAAVRDALRYQIDEAQQQQQQPHKTGDDAAPARRTARKSKSNAQDNEEFLMNYILNRGWMENPQAAPKLKRPRQSHYEDEDSDQDDESKPRNLSSTNGTTTRDWEAEAADLEDAASDASFDSRAEAFEQAFNFRYEALEAGKVSDQIQSYARQHPSSSSTNATVRRVEDKRKQEREERRRRKEAEKRSRMEEIDRLRELKKGSLREKLRQLKEAAGSTKLNIDKDELEGDFDEEKHEKLMKAFGEAYYGEEGDDDVKPTWDDDVDIEDILAEERQEENNGEEEKPKKLSKNQRKKELRRLQELAEEEEQEQEADDAVDDEGTSTSKLSKKDRKKLKKQAKKAGAASDATSNADPSSSTSSMTPSERREAARKLADEYRSLDHEDVIGDLPTRFHYTPRDFEHDLAAHMGSAFSLEPVLTQSAWFRTHNRDDTIPNLYFVGAGTHPGAGIPGVVGSAKATARLMIEDMK